MSTPPQPSQNLLRNIWRNSWFYDKLYNPIRVENVELPLRGGKITIKKKNQTIDIPIIFTK